MSVYNGENYVEMAIKSILKQTYKDFEFIIIDDGSIDNTFNIIKRYAEKDKRIKILKNYSNIGLPKSLNKAIKYSQGKFIARQDADDISLPQRLEKQLIFLKKNPDYAFCGTNGFRKQNNQELIKFFEIAEIRKNLIVANCFSHPSIVIRKKILKKYGYYDEKFLYTQDYDLWCRLIYKYKLKAKNLKEKLIIKEISLDRFLKRDKKRFLNQKLNSIITKFRYLKYTRFKLKCLISILIYWIEMLTLCSIMEYFSDFLKKINL